MAQYSNLKAYIEEKIYENGTQAITGDILQDVLKVMTDDLGEFYQMGGVASPSTDPGTPDAKVIYIATEAGTYTNFGGITLAAGEVALLIFETSWTKETLNVLSAANGGVKTANLADGAVTTEKIAGGAVETAKIANNAVTSGKVADGAIGTAKIADGAIAADKIAANAVESAKIKNGAVTEGKINDGAVTAGKVAANAVTTAKIADDAVTTAKLNDGAVTEDKIATDAVTSGKVKDGAIGTAKIAAGAVTHAKIGAGAVEESNIKDGAVTSDKIANGAVGSDQLAEGAFSAENLADGSVTTDKLADDAVTAEKIADGAVTADKFANGSVTTIKLGSGAVTTEKIGDGMVTRQKLADSSVGTSKIIDGAVTTDKVADGAITDAKLENPVSVSQNTLSIGGNYAGEVSTTYDVTLHNNGTTFDSLEALLSDANLNTLIPLAVRKGGMSIKFVQSSDNKYVQYRLNKNSFSSSALDWQGVYESLLTDVASNDIAKSCSVATERNNLLMNIISKLDEDLFFTQSQEIVIHDSSGQPILPGYSNAKRTQLIPCKQGDQFAYTLRSSGTMLISVYNENGVLDFSNSVVATGSTQAGTYIIPLGISFIQFICGSNRTPSVRKVNTRYIDKIPTKDSDNLLSSGEIYNFGNGVYEKGFYLIDSDWSNGVPSGIVDIDYSNANNDLPDNIYLGVFGYRDSNKAVCLIQILDSSNNILDSKYFDASSNSIIQVIILGIVFTIDSSKVSGNTTHMFPSFGVHLNKEYIGKNVKPTFDIEVGQKILCLGDSVTQGDYIGNNVGMSYPARMANLLQSNVFNGGIGGAEFVVDSSTQGNNFCEIVDAMTGVGDWTSLNSYLASIEHEATRTMLQARFAQIESIDFNTIDILTIAYGTNDWNHSRNLENNDNPFDKTTILGALRYGVTQLLTYYPQLRIYVFTPSFRNKLGPNDDQNSDTYANGNNVLLPTVCEQIVSTCKSLHIPCKNNYIEYANDYNAAYLFAGGGGVHPNDTGAYLLAKVYSKFIASH